MTIPSKKIARYSLLPLFAIIGGVMVSTAPSLAQSDRSGEYLESEAIINLEADDLVYDNNLNTVTATGTVTLRHLGYLLIADTVVLDESNNTVKAIGHVQITDPQGNILILDEAMLNRALTQGFIENVRLIMNDGSRLVARNGRREADGRSTLNEVSFTPCRLCEDEPNKEPIWQIRAERVEHDENEERLYYKDAVLDIMGVPVLYLPYLSHPDPSVERASGILAPEIRGARGLGASIALPYHHVISPSSDLTITPIINTSANPVLALEYREKTSKGEFFFETSGTYTSSLDYINNTDHKLRGHVFSNGYLQHASKWRSNYQLNLATDDTYLRRYGFADLDTLTNYVQTEALYGRSYFSARAVGFQGLQIEDDQGLSAMALPLINSSFISKPGSIGQVYRADFSALSIVRTEGADTFRISGSASWELPYTNAIGQRFVAKVGMRGDAYHASDSLNMDNARFAGQDGSEARFLPYISTSFSWPFIQAGNNNHQIIEPIIKLISAPEKPTSNLIPNEDSRTFELTDSNIFDENRFPGIDRLEGGSRVNYGVRWQVESPKISTDIVVAQSYRVDAQPALYGPSSGLDGKFSDFVGRAQIELKGVVRLDYRFRLDKQSLDVRRNEIDASIGNEENYGTIGYFKLNRGPNFIGLSDREEIHASASFALQDNWRLFGDIIRDLTNGDDPIAHNVGVMYRDECLEMSLAWRKSFTFDRDIRKGSSIMFRISLKHLG